MLEVTNLGCVRGARALFSDLNLSVPAGTLLQINGANGSGKASLLRIICGLLTPDQGEVRWKQTNIRVLGEDFYSDLVYLGHRNGIKEELSAVENLRIADGLAGISTAYEAALAALKAVGLEGRETLAARRLSEGQKRRAALARLLTRKAKLWVLDEVLASLDSDATTLVNTLIERHLCEGGLAIVATHQELQLAGSHQHLNLNSHIG